MKLHRKKILMLIFCVILIIQIIYIPHSVKASTYTQTTKTGISNFPASYQAKLNELKSLYPNWTFTAFNTGINWDEFIREETSLHLRNTVIKSSNALWLDSCGQVASGYACASTPILKYYSDPRNFLNESGIFQFLEMTYNPNSQTEAGVRGIIASTFMNTNVTFNLNGTECTMPYSAIIMEAAKQSKMSPYSIAIKIIQEVGRNGSASVSGHYVAKNGTVYDNYYNFFNYGAYDTGDAIANGLEYAKANGWTNQYISIIEGAKKMANSYTNAGQNTAYFYKWDVVGTELSQLFKHQYMTNIQDPSSQAKNLFNTYAKNNLLNSSLNFIIPVFNNMPESNNLPTTIDTTLPNSYYLTGSDVRLRQAPTTSASILGTLKKNEVVTVLEFNVGTANNLQWAKVQLSNGNVGYIANKYLAPCNNGAGNKIAKIEGKNLVAIPGKTIAEIASSLSVTNYSVRAGDLRPLQSNYPLTTGDKFTINGTEYEVVVLGDIYADRVIDARDYMKIKNHIMGISQLNEIEQKASQVHADGVIDARDYMKIKNHIMGISSITM